MNKHLGKTIEKDLKQANFTFRNAAKKMRQITKCWNAPDGNSPDGKRHNVRTEAAYSAMLSRIISSGKMPNGIQYLLSELFDKPFDRYIEPKQFSERLALSIHQSDYEGDLYCNPSQSGNDTFKSAHIIAIYFYFLIRSKGFLYIFKKQREKVVIVQLIALYAFLKEENQQLHTMDILSIQKSLEKMNHIVKPHQTEQYIIGSFPREFYEMIESRMRIFTIYDISESWKNDNSLKVAAYLNPVSYYFIDSVEHKDGLWTFGMQNSQFNELGQHDSENIYRRFQLMTAGKAGYNQISKLSIAEVVSQGKQQGIIFSNETSII